MNSRAEKISMILGFALLSALITFLPDPGLSQQAFVNSVAVTITDPMGIASGDVRIDAVDKGYIGSQTISAGMYTATKIGTLDANTKAIEMFGDDAWAYGDAGVASGLAGPYVATLTTKILNVATTTPNIYVIGCLKSPTIKILYRQ